MFDIIKKKEYWRALDNNALYNSLGGSQRALDGLKHIQDFWMLDRLNKLVNLNICEIGGANSRVLPRLSTSNELWNVDEFKGEGNGPTVCETKEHIKYVSVNVGDFSNELPSSYFDVVFSISVIEHIPVESLENFWMDSSRILKRGGTALHVIDAYVNDILNRNVEALIDKYILDISKAGLRFKQHPALRRPLIFSSDMASNSDWGMWRWNKCVPILTEKREASQSVSLALELLKI